MDSSKANNAIKILVVDDDSTCLAVVAAVLRQWNYYQVATVKDPMEALLIIRREGGFGLVVADVHMPEMNGFQLMHHITSEFHLPVVLMSVDDKESLVAKGLDLGATLFISKPVSVDDVRDLWQIAAVASNSKDDQNSDRVTAAPPPVCGGGGVDDDGALPITITDDDNDDEAANAEPTENNKVDDKTTEIIKEGIVTFKIHKITGKKKLVWTANLHYKFMQAINTIGLHNAVPKKILDLMDVPGITRENIASHLQKYRLFLRRVAEVSSAIQRNIDCRNNNNNNLRPRINNNNNNNNIGGRRMGAGDMFSGHMLNNDQRRRFLGIGLGIGGEPTSSSFGVGRAPIGTAAAFLSSTLFSSNHHYNNYGYNHHGQVPLPPMLHGYGYGRQSSLLSPLQRYNHLHHLGFYGYGRPTFMPANNNPIYQPNYTQPAILPPPNRDYGVPAGADAAALAADETNNRNNEMVMGSVRPPSRDHGVPANPLDFDFVFDDDDEDDDVFSLLHSDDDLPTLTHNYSNPSSAVAQGGNPLSPLSHDPILVPGKSLQPSHDPINIVATGGGAGGGGDENSSTPGPFTPLPMIDNYFADPPLDGTSLANLFSTNNQSEDYVVSSNFSNNNNNNNGDDENQVPQFEDIPGLEQFLEPRNNEEFLESVFAPMPFSGQAQNPKDDHNI